MSVKVVLTADDGQFRGVLSDDGNYCAAAAAPGDHWNLAGD